MNLSLRGRALAIGKTRVHEKEILHRLSTKEHPELHIVSTGETEFDLPREFSQDYRDTNKRADLFMPSRIANRTLPNHLCITLDYRIRFVLVWVNKEANTVLPLFGGVSIDGKRVERGSASPRVDFRLDVRDAEGGNGKPLSPTDDVK